MTAEHPDNIWFDKSKRKPVPAALPLKQQKTMPLAAAPIELEDSSYSELVEEPKRPRPISPVVESATWQIQEAGGKWSDSEWSPALQFALERHLTKVFPL